MLRSLRQKIAPKLPRGCKLFLKKFQPNYLYYLWYRRKNPAAFQGSIPGGPPIVDCMAGFNFSPAVVRWFADDGDGTLRLDYPLNENSVVFDVGGFVGDWAAAIEKRYGSKVYVFEPNPESFKALEDAFRSSLKVSIYPYGLSGKTKEVNLTLAGIGSSAASTVQGQSNTITILLRDIKEVVDEFSVNHIDLMKINIEGGEYSLLQRMIDAGLVTAVRDIQVQFHRCIPDADAVRRRLQEQLSKTHICVWDYPFVWESWTRRPGSA